MLKLFTRELFRGTISIFYISFCHIKLQMSSQTGVAGPTGQGAQKPVEVVDSTDLVIVRPIQSMGSIVEGIQVKVVSVTRHLAIVSYVF